MVSSGLTGNQVQYDPKVQDELRILGLKDADGSNPAKAAQDSAHVGDEDADAQEGLGRLIEFISKKKAIKKQSLRSSRSACHALRAYQSLDETEYQIATQGRRLDRRI